MRSKDKQIELLHKLIAIAQARGKEGENEWLEFKTNISESHASITYERVGCYLSGLSNSACLKYQDHGYLVLGVEDATWEIVGTNLVMPEARVHGQNFELWLRKNMDPMLNFEIEEFDYAPGVHIVIFEIPATRGVPVQFKNEAYVRIGSNLTKLKDFPDYLRQIYNSGVDWSAEITPDATIDDLDPKAIEVARENYANKHEHLREEMKRWSDIEFLNRAKITRNGEVTNAAIILLGKPESEVLISPAVSKLRWIVKDSMGVELDYEICSCPMILAVDKVYGHIRNLKYRMINPALQSLFPDEMDTYEPYVIREAMNNAIAHQDYSKGGMVNVVEFEDRLVFTNLGSFIPGTIKHVLESDAPEENYHNKFLAQAMVELKMVDTIGSGIRRMFGYQKRRLFPMPDYEFSDNRVKLTIIGKVLDLKYANQLAKNAELTLVEIEMLNRVQLGKSLSNEEIAYLRKRGLVEGRKGALVVSKLLAQKSGLEVDYSKHKGLSDDKCEALLLTALQDHGQLARQSIVELLWNVLPCVLDDKKKQNKINNLLKKLKREGKIDNSSHGNISCWFIVRE